MLGAIEVMGIGLLGWYIFLSAMSFCTIMMGYSYLKNSGAVPDDYNAYPGAVVIALVPIFNVILAIQTLRLARITCKDPKARDKYRKSFDKMKKEIERTADEIMRMSRDDDDNEK